MLAVTLSTCSVRFCWYCGTPQTADYFAVNIEEEMGEEEEDEKEEEDEEE